MLALSIRQPWAWLIVQGIKDIENRVWPTNVRGPVLIHAATKCYRDDWEVAEYRYRLHGASGAREESFPRFGELPRGGIVGEATLVDCVSDSPSAWFEGPFGFVLRGARMRPFAPFRGRLKFFEVNLRQPLRYTEIQP